MILCVTASCVGFGLVIVARGCDGFSERPVHVVACFPQRLGVYVDACVQM